jgi:phosphoglycolate phosphatase
MTILWDWNGTLVADVAHVVAMNNLVLEQFGYRHTSEEEYRAKFRHPVHEYYYDLGVTEEDFPKVAKVWNKAYVDGFDCVPLAPGAADAVRRFRQAGHQQVIISASQVDQLRAQVVHFPELRGVFDEVLGLSNQLAVSKVHLATDFLARTGADASECVFIGDTTHDAETAAAIGCRCFLVAGGHQNRDVLETAPNATVVSSLEDVLAALSIPE